MTYGTLQMQTTYLLTYIVSIYEATGALISQKLTVIMYSLGINYYKLLHLLSVKALACI